VHGIFIGCDKLGQKVTLYGARLSLPGDSVRCKRYLKDNCSMTSHPSHLRALVIVLAVLAAGCSERHSAASSDAANNSSSQQATPESAPLQDAEPQDILKAELAAGGVPATYEASFEEGQLKRITEERKPVGAAARRADYVFYGARLLEYSGAALRSDATVALRFDMQGGLASSSGSTGKPDDVEISAIRNRAQLLRSHALARRSVRGHGGAAPVR
jgi:hypothetical protein